MAYLIEPVDDMNEVTYHYLDTIYTHLFNTKGPLPGKASVGGGAAVAQPMNVSAFSAPLATTMLSSFTYLLLALLLLVVVLCSVWCWPFSS